MPASPSHLALLKSFLESPDRPQGTLRYHELQGFLFAVTSSPELIKPAEWLPIVFGDKEAGYRSLDEANAVLGELMVLYNAINAHAMEDHARVPDDCILRRSAMSNFDDDAPITQWSRGFAQGHDWLEEVWDAYVPEEFSNEFGVMLMALTFFASEKLAKAYLKEVRRKDLKKMAAEVVDVFPEAVAEYARIGRSIGRIVSEK